MSRKPAPPPVEPIVQGVDERREKGAEDEVPVVVLEPIVPGELGGDGP